MKKYNILEAIWNDNKHDCLLLKVSEFEDEKEIRTFQYTSGNGHASLDQLLWKMALDNSEMIQESLLTKVLNGEIEVPEGFTLINDQLLNDEEERIKMRAIINQRLDDLYSGRALVTAERDSIYAENRLRQIDWLLSIENAPGFPYNINWEELENI